MYLSHTIVKNIVSTEVQLANLGGNTLSEKQLAQLRKELETQMLFYLLNEIGINISVKDTFKLLGDKQIITKDFRGQLVENLKAVLELCHTLAANKEMEINATVILQINQTLGKGTTEEWQLNYRAAGEAFSLVYDDLAEYIDPQKQFPAGVSESYGTLVTKFLEKYNSFDDENQYYKVSQLIYELISIHPFIAYNKFTIILTAYMLLLRVTSATKPFINPAELFIHSKSEIIRVLEIANPEERERTWHEKFTAFCAEQIESKSKNLPSVKESTSKNDKPFLDLNRRQLKILKYLQTIPTLKREDYVQMTGVSAMTAFRDLQVLLKHKLIRSIGVGRGTKYTLYSR